MEELIELAYTLGIESGDLDEDVHDAASNLASMTNNDGVESQIKFLIEQYGETGTRDILNEITGKKDKES